MDLSIIIVSFNTKKLTTECIESILRNTKGLTYEIIIVDNASNDGSIDAIHDLKIKYPISSLKLIENKKNLGFAKANNIGASKSKGKYFLFLNSDTLIKNNFLKSIVSWMEENKNVAVSTCALKNKDGSMQGSGGYFPTLFRVFSWMFFIEDIPFLDKLIKPFHPIHSKSPIYKGLGQFKKRREQDWVTGAFFLTRKKIFDRLKGFDVDYFMYTEEVDLCFRIKKLGYKIYYLPDWEIIHLGGASSSKEFPILSEYKNIKLFYKKNMPKWQFPFLRAFLKTGALLRAFIFGIIEGKSAYEIYIKANNIA